MPPLGVIADLAVRPHPDPLRDRAVLLRLLGERHLSAKALVRRLERRGEQAMRQEGVCLHGESKASRRESGYQISKQGSIVRNKSIDVEAHARRGDNELAAKASSSN